MRHENWVKMDKRKFPRLLLFQWCSSSLLFSWGVSSQWTGCGKCSNLRPQILRKTKYRKTNKRSGFSTPFARHAFSLRIKIFRWCWTLICWKDYIWIDTRVIFGVTDMDIFGRIKIFGSERKWLYIFYSRSSHPPFSDGSALKLDAFLVTTTGEKMVKLMVVTF